IASGGSAPRSRTTRAAARRFSAGSTASRYGSPPRSGVAVEARKTVIAVKSGWLTLVGGIGPRLLTRTAAQGQERRECSHDSAPSQHEGDTPVAGLTGRAPARSGHIR